MIRSKTRNRFLFCIALLLPGAFFVLPFVWLWRRYRAARLPGWRRA